MITIKIINAIETYSIRKRILRKNMDSSEKLQGDFDANTIHVGAYEKEQLIGVASFMKNIYFEGSKLQYQLRGMAILENRQGLGVGNKIIEFAEFDLKKKETSILWCNAREIAVSFYQRNKMKIIGKPFLVDKIGTHFVMYKNL